METKTDIRTVSLEDLRKKFTELGEKSFRADQVYRWLWNRSSVEFSGMTNISLEMRRFLDDHFEIKPARSKVSQVSSDGTIKSVFSLHDGSVIEGVLIPRKHRMTACVSSQVGCSLSCKFCATGYLDRRRNLDPGEIYDQVVLIDKLARENYDSPLTNIVFMGMGEPLLNYSNVMEAIRLITSETGLNMSAKRITLSTAGISKMIRKLADDNVKFKLAVSLHAANDKKRNRIMPINETNSLKSLSEALQDFFHATRSRITFEYIVFKDFNDSPEDAEELYQFVRKIPCKINIIEYNPIREAKFENSSSERIEYLAKYLEMKEINVKIRRSRGKDIDAACGQLAGRHTLLES